jgi:hypothetical protein
MISKMSDNQNNNLYSMLTDMLGLSWQELTRMKDKEVISIFEKLAFQYRQNIGAFAYGHSWAHHGQNIDAIESEIVDMEILK